MKVLNLVNQPFEFNAVILHLIREVLMTLGFALELLKISEVLLSDPDFFLVGVNRTEHIQMLVNVFEILIDSRNNADDQRLLFRYHCF